MTDNTQTPESGSDEPGRTGHEWDGIEEYTNPLPKWWVYTFYATIIWSVAYMVVMPAVPFTLAEGWTYTKGVLGYSQRDIVAKDVEDAKAQFAGLREQIAGLTLDEIRQNRELHDFALASGEAAFGDNCAGCHGLGAQGFTGFPNLNDDDWLWGGTLGDIEQTIRHGVRWIDDFDTRYSEMPAYLRDGMLTEEQIADVTHYVLKISGQDYEAAAALRGSETFLQECSVCHMESGAGDPLQGAPNLTDPIWLYGSDEASIRQTIAYSRFGVMPAWAGRLDQAVIKELALYVHALGGGEDARAEEAMP
ncbi:MAG: cytochrome-c oxidase, cbb3-type subunit III [Sphingomonadales bacterium]|nr:cytochrome-c oxidase, cbb3-type subunit III [Sphingomonadales bacterium]